METIKEILDGVKERLSSPLFGAFAVAWAICNWDILICLWTFDLTMLNNCGWSSYTECVSEQVNWLKGFWIPLASTAVYILIYPPVKGLIAVFNSWVGKHLGNAEIRQRRKALLEVETVIRLQEDQEKQGELLAERISRHDETIKRKAELEMELGTKQSELSNLKENLLTKENELAKAVADAQDNRKQSSVAKAAHLIWEKQMQVLRVERDGLQHRVNEMESEEVTRTINQEVMMNVVHDSKDVFQSNGKERKYRDIEYPTFVLNARGTIAIWAKVNKELLDGKSGENKYLFSHASKKHIPRVDGQGKYYPNSMSIGNMHGEKRYWKAFLYDDKGEMSTTQVQINEDVAEGWHLFVIQWDQFKKVFRFSIDLNPKQTGETIITSFPTKLEGPFRIGSWVSDHVGHFLDAEIGPYRIWSTYINEVRLEEYWYASKPEKVEVQGFAYD